MRLCLTILHCPSLFPRPPPSRGGRPRDDVITGLVPRTLPIQNLLVVSCSPIQLSIAFSISILKVTESWAVPGNEAKSLVLRRYVTVSETGCTHLRYYVNVCTCGSNDKGDMKALRSLLIKIICQLVHCR